MINPAVYGYTTFIQSQTKNKNKSTVNTKRVPVPFCGHNRKRGTLVTETP